MYRPFNYHSNRYIIRQHCRISFNRQEQGKQNIKLRVEDMFQLHHQLLKNEWSDKWRDNKNSYGDFWKEKIAKERQHLFEYTIFKLKIYF
jgi:hypothetical protein